MTDIINEEETNDEIPEEQEEEVVVDNGQTYESTESAIIAKQEADKAKLWAQESERQAGLAADSATTAVEARDDAIAAKEYAEAAITDENLIVVATDLQATPSNIKTVATNISNVNTVAGIASDVTTVSSNTANISAVASNSTNINAVAGNSSNINAVAGNATNINAVNANKTNIDTVAGISSDVTAVAGNATNISDVASNSSNINAVASNATNINDVAGNATNINAVAGDIANINAVAADLANIDNASTYANNANIWAEGTDAQVQALGGVHSSKGWADRSSQGQVQADWDEADSTEKSYIKNKPTNLVTTDTAQTISGAKTLLDKLTLGNSTGHMGQIELFGGNSAYGGYIDFHYGNDSGDYTSRIIENSSGNINLDCTSVTAPTPGAASNTTNVATTVWIKNFAKTSGANYMTTFSKAGNGYYKFTNGLIIQWGTSAKGSSKTVTLPTAFTSTNYKVAVNNQTTNGGGYYSSATTKTTTNFVIHSSGGATSYDNDWIAIGY